VVAVEIAVDRDLCASTGNCVLIAPEVFHFEGDELVYLRSPGEAYREQVEDAVRSCPMQAISLTLTPPE
jgi:ferredoxin